MIQLYGRSKQAEHRFLSKYGRHDGDTKIHLTVFRPHPEMAVLGNPLLRDIQVCHDLNTGNQRLMYTSLQGDIFQNHTVDSHPDFGFPVKRLDMNIAGIAFDRPFHQTVEQVDDRRFLIRVLQAGQIQFLQLLRHESGVGPGGRLPRPHLRKIVRDCLAQRFFL